MSAAEPFTALVGGSGFPLCPESGSLVFLGSLTLAESMALYWNLKSLRVEFSIDVTSEHRTSAPIDPPTYNTITRTYVYDKVVSENGVDSGQNPPAPKARVCNTFWSFQDTAGAPTTISPIDIAPRSFRIAPAFVGKDSGVYSLRNSAGIGTNNSLSFGIRPEPHPDGGGTATVLTIFRRPNATASPFSTSTLLPDLETGTFWGKSISLEIWVRLLDKPFTGAQYVSHTFNSFSVTPDFWTY
jgi:hypothetical protein